MIAGKTLQVDGKDVRCPSPPLYLVKSFGHTIDLDMSHYNATCTYDRAVAAHKELWKIDEHGVWKLLRQKRCGKEIDEHGKAISEGVAGERN